MAKNLVRFLSINLFRLHQKGLKRAFGINILLVLISLFLFTQLKHIKVILSADDMVGEGIASADELKEIQSRFEDGPTATLIIRPPNRGKNFSLSELCTVRKWYYDQIFNLNHLKNAISQFDIRKPTKTPPDQLVYRQIMKMDCGKLKPFNFSPENLQKHFNETPFYFTKSKTGDLNIVLNFTFYSLDEGKFGSFDPRSLDSIRNSLKEELTAMVPGIVTHWVGPADYQWWVHKGLKFSSVLNLALILLLILCLRLTFGTWKSGILYSFCFVVPSFWIYGLKGFANSPFDVLSNSLFLILGVSALEDFTFLSFAQMSGNSWKKSMRQMIVPSFFTSLTTVVGFSSLYSSELEIIRRLGIWSAAGAIIEWLFLFIFLPCLLNKFFKNTTWVNPSKSIFRKKLLQGTLWAPQISTFRFSMVVYPLALVSVFYLNVNDSPKKLFPKNHPYQVGLDYLNESKGWLGSVSLLSHSPDEKIKDSLILKIKENLPNPNVISGWESIQSLEQFAYEGQSEVRKSLIQRELPMSFAYRQLVDKDNIERAQLYLSEIDSVALQTLNSVTQKICGDSCHLGGSLIAYSDFTLEVPKTLLSSMLMSLALVFSIIVFLSFALGKTEILFGITLSSFWGIAAMLIIVTVFQVPVNFLTCIFASVLVGLTGDNAIQYLFASQKSGLFNGIQKRGGASIITATVMAIGSLVFLGSHFDPPKIFGVLLASGLLASLVGDLWLLNTYIKSNTNPGKKLPKAQA